MGGVRVPGSSQNLTAPRPMMPFDPRDVGQLIITTSSLNNNSTEACGCCNKGRQRAPSSRPCSLDPCSHRILKLAAGAWAACFLVGRRRCPNASSASSALILPLLLPAAATDGDSAPPPSTTRPLLTHYALRSTPAQVRPAAFIRGAFGTDSIEEAAASITQGGSSTTDPPRQQQQI